MRIYYEDTDFSGFVYHANYVRYLERGRSDLLRATGLTHRALAAGEPPLGFMVRRMEIDFRSPARIEDVVEVRTRFTQLRGARLMADQRIVRDGDLLLSAAVEVAVVSEGRPRRLPGPMAARIEAFLDLDAPVL